MEEKCCVKDCIEDAAIGYHVCQGHLWAVLPTEKPEGVEQWEWELGKTDPEQRICGYCGAPYYPGDPVYCASCAPNERGY